MAAEEPKKKPQKPSEVKKRALKSAPRKEGVPILKKPKKQRKWVWGIGAVIVLFFAAVFLVPPYGTMRYGICKTFVQMNDPYPGSLEFMQAYEEGTMVVLDYNRIDTFGQRTLNQIRCYFNDDLSVPQLTRVDVNGKSTSLPQEDPEVVKKFNSGIPAIISTSPSLVMPEGLSDDIKDYR